MLVHGSGGAVTLAYRVVEPATSQQPTAPDAIVITRGGRKGIVSTAKLARLVADKTGCAVLVWDRRLSGSSSAVLPDASVPLPVADMDDLRLLLDALKLQRVWLLGSSSGARLSFMFAHAYPQRVAGLIIAPATGGPRALIDVDELYFAGPKRLCEQGGMRAVAAAADAYGGNGLLDIDAAAFCKLMTTSSQWLAAYRDAKVVGVTDAQLAGLRGRVPALVAHSGDVADALHDAATAIGAAAALGCASVAICPDLLSTSPALAELTAAFVGSHRAKL